MRKLIAMKMTGLPKAAAWTVLVAAAACSDNQSAADRRYVGGAELAEAATRAESEPTKGAQIASRPRAASWREFVRQQAAPDARYLNDLDRRYYGALAFESPEEREFLLRSGFPMPEDWLAAKSMTDEQLQKAADSGDRKAAGIYADRMAAHLADLLELSKATPGAASDRDRARAAALAINYAHIASDGSRGAFGVYVQGMVKSIIFQSPEALTASMLESMDRGDPRTGRLIDEMARRHPRQNVEEIFGLYKNLHSSAGSG